MVEHVLAKDETGVRFSLTAQNRLNTIKKNLKIDLLNKIPKEVSHVTSTLRKAGFEVFLVGGCVRDLFLDREPKDWDVTTNAKPEQIIALFEKTVYENTFGTVGVVVSRETATPSNLHLVEGEMPKAEGVIVEVTPYRIEAKYSDFRHPDEVKFSDNLTDDLKRRDFTINAMAIDSKGPAQSLKDIESGWHLTDLYEGIKDIENKTLRTVGSADERFNEDALRMLRAVRFACQLNFSISSETTESILKNSNLIKEISSERIRDEFIKIILSDNPASGLVMLQKFGLLKNIIPELEEGIGCEQLGEHIYDVWDHLLHALQHAADKKWPLEIRLSALFHDIGKPKTRRIASQENAFRHSHSVLEVQDSSVRSEDSSKHIPATLSPRESENILSPKSKKKYTFYGHEVVGARITKKIMERLKFSKKEIDLVEKLVRNHMFFSDTELITLSAVRRVVTKVGVDNIWFLMNVRECDRVGMKKKEAPYRLRKYFAMIEEALHDPISVGALKINGEFMIKDMSIKPGPRMGWMLNALLEEVLEDPKKNTIEYLKDKILELEKLSDAELKALGDKGKEKKEELEEEEVEKLHAKHGVRSGKGEAKK